MDLQDLKTASSALSLPDIQSLMSHLESLVEAKKAETKAKFLASMKAQADELGLDYEELIGSEKSTAKKGKGVPKYCHPTNSNKTWTGKGRKPQWLVNFLEEGRDLTEFAIG